MAKRKRAWFFLAFSSVAIAIAVAVAVVHASELKRDEEVLLYPTTALKTDGAWHIALHGLVFETEVDASAIQDFLKLIGVGDKAKKGNERGSGVEADENQDRQKGEKVADRSSKELDAAIIAERIRPFLADAERAKEISIDVCGHSFAMPLTDDDGHFHADIELPADALAECIEQGDTGRESMVTKVVTPKGDDRKFSGRVELIDATGLSVISDLDDTIKITENADMGAMLANTLARPFREVPGMVDLYQRWARDYRVQFHYVSDSPWPLFTPLARWFEEVGYPRGTIHLRKTEAIRRELFGADDEAADRKGPRIRALLKRFPGRQFILVGDAVLKDPEVYSDIARDHPDQVMAIFIRLVGDQPADDQRFKEAFKDIPPERWKLFRGPEELAGWKPK